MLEVNTLLREDLGHADELVVRAPMDSFNLIVLSLIVKFGRDDSTKEGSRSPLKSDGDLQFLKFEMFRDCGVEVGVELGLD